MWISKGEYQILHDNLNLYQDERDFLLEAQKEAKYTEHPFGFTITEIEDGRFYWVTWRWDCLYSSMTDGYKYWDKEYHDSDGRRMPKGYAKSPYTAELKARKALVPFQTEKVTVEKAV